ncbi:MAG: ferrous iron transport protein A [Cytophagales bacterium]|nr:MAG: ferrous iron transport protein A [Cytophagales bacterium]TAF61505.1 MAG: ferrous iron transport protein A [Cytophagales bacterium]
MKRATELLVGEQTQIEKLAEVPVALKLLELGLVPHALITLIRKAPLGCPLYFSVDGNFLALRQNEAEHIFCA